MYWYWWAWFAIVVFAVLIPLAYGWGYRGWGPPYPRYYYRRRPQPRALPDGAARRSPRGQVLLQDPTPPVYDGWGLFADLFWMAVVGAAIWAVVAWTF